MTMNPGGAPSGQIATGYPGPQYAPPLGAPVTSPCPVCGTPWSGTRSCQMCRQVVGLPPGTKLASPGRRLGAYLLDALLSLVTVGIGWLIWSLIVWGKGQTPGKQLLKMRVMSLENGRPATWGRMALREFVCKGVIGIAAGFTIVGFVAYFWLLWDKDNQELWDKMASTVVIDDPANTFAPENLPPAFQFAPPPGMAAPAAPAPYQPGSYQGGPAGAAESAPPSGPESPPA